MLLHALKTDGNKVENIFWLGRRIPIEADTDNVKSRPIKQVVENVKIKMENFTEYKKLEGSGDRRMEQSIHPQGSNTEAQDGRNLMLKEFKKKQQKGEKNVKII